MIAVQGGDLAVAGVPLTLKLELFQHSGSFKARGAFVNLLAREIPPAGVVAASGGNHGAAVAFAAHRLGIPARIYVPTVASPVKIGQIRAYGAELVIGGIAAWYGGRIRLVGVEPEAAPTLTRALEAGRPVDAEAGGLAADSLGPRRVGSLMFPLAQRYVERVVLVTDDAIRAAQEALWTTLRVASEPGGAAAFAALLSSRYRPSARRAAEPASVGGDE